MNRVYILFVALFILASCEKEVTDVKIPGGKPKLVLGCFLSAEDSLITVSLTKSAPIFTQKSTSSSNFVDKASVTISDGLNSVIIPDKGYGNYQLNSKLFPILEGKEYTVSASAAGYDKVSGKCNSIPNFISYASAIATGTFNSNNNSIAVTWQDVPNQKNYYFIDVYARLVNDSITLNDSIHRYISYSTSTTYKDDGKDGQKIETIIKLDKTYLEKNYKFKGYLIRVLNMDYNYYMYSESLDNYNHNPSNPFSEPSFVYTNIDNGLGVVGGYSLYRFYIN